MNKTFEFRYCVYSRMNTNTHKRLEMENKSTYISTFYNISDQLKKLNYVC